ncbi:M91 family zinc metallopeptidase [Pseudomonas aeruginosa]|uniref:M91 family zinc metallopeptidase n=1 Tax=Pseudomonas aeruginosa TaxID=287 RepID=UPI0007649BAB|nr:M91 family zinc metallopeptidase [Pseudomonas aeruginosa]
MPRTIEYWRPTNGLYHATPPGIAVLTQDSDWEVLNEATGFYEESPYPSAFKGQVYRALNYINATPTGASLLWNLYTTNNFVDITPSSLGINVQSTNQPMALNQVAREIIVGTGPGPQTQIALNQTGIAPQAQTQWLTYVINSSPHWALDGVPGNGGGLYGYLERARQYANRWMLLFDHRYFRWSDSNEGYFNEQSYSGHFGISAHNIAITNHEVAAWLAGQPLPHRLSDAQQNHARLATIVALKDVSPPSAGCSAHVRWNPTATNPLNRIRPPAIGLAHELLHAYYSCRGAQPGYDDNHYSTVLFEYRCVGLGPWDEAPLSENALRKEWWSYACQQVPGSDPENRKAIGKRISYM